MPDRAIRFLVASDLHLEQPVTGLADPPEFLRDLMVEAPYLAAERVFETALSENVDFLLLAGDVVDPWASGPRGPAFLVEQFRRLAAREISVLWAGSPLDRLADWPLGIALPANITTFAHGHPQERVVHRGEARLARVLGVSVDGTPHPNLADFAASDDLFSIGLVHGHFDSQQLRQAELNCWALGGEHRRNVLSNDTPTVLYPGSVQGRHPRELGAHGCTLVEVSRRPAVDHERRPPRYEVRCRSIHTDVLRWENVELHAEHLTSREQLKDALVTQLAALHDQSRDTDLVVNVTVLADSSRVADWRSYTPPLLEQVRQALGRRSPTCWTATISFRIAADHDHHAEEDTLLGDMLRELHRYGDEPSLEVELSKYLSERQLAGTLGAALEFLHGDDRSEVLADATALAIELLGPGAGDGTQSIGAGLPTSTGRRETP
ncbi:MAG: exonuclease SbcCD subunit D [Pirellulales bacterium]